MCGTICTCFLLLLILGNSIFSHWKLPLLSKPYCFSGHQTWIPSAWTWKQDDQLKLFCDSKRNPPKTLNQPLTVRFEALVLFHPFVGTGHRGALCWWWFCLCFQVVFTFNHAWDDDHWRSYFGDGCGQLNHLPLVIGWCVHIHTQSPHFGWLTPHVGELPKIGWSTHRFSMCPRVGRWEN